ncbi:beta strand repeat-containing protein [Leclercia sp. AS011]|uniref:beta strand repeat-containing protein n=1 Tax=Leclercia sp. AS011 TaxID=3081257 RepID=UPI00301B012B
MNSETQMKPRQYTLNTGKTRITLQAGQTNIHKAAPGETYRVLKRQGEDDREKLADDVVASRHGQDLHLDYADGTTLTLQDWFTQSDTSVTLPADGTSTQVMTPGSTEGAALADGSHVFYAHGSPDALASMTSGHPGLESLLSGLQNGSVVSGHPITYLPQSHSYVGYLAGALGLGGVIGVAAASGHSGSDNGSKHDNGGGEPAVQNAVELNFVGGPALSTNDLNVEIYQADGKTLIGTGTLGPNGSVTVSAGSYSGVVIVKLVNSGSAADYMDEATGVGKDLSAQLWSMGVISGDNSTLVLNINVLTTLAYHKAQEALGGTTDSPATLSATQVADTSAAISSLFGVDDILNTTVVATNGGSYDATDGLSAGEKYGLLLAAFSGAEANAGASTQTILDAVTAGITLGGSSGLSDEVQSLLIKGAAAASDTSGGLSHIIDTHAPVFTSATTASVDENIGAGQVVWTAVATDPSQFSYSLSTTGDSGLFSINASTGAVTLTGNPDFESKASYSFTVVATDAAGNASSQTVTLGINNLDDAAPTITSGATATAIDENSGAGQVIYTATATDTADISGGVTFSLKAGSDAGLTIDPITGAVTLTGNPDYESKASYSFTVVATDAAGNASSQKVTLDINNLDEVAPTITSGATATAIDENSGAGQVIYTATATDTADISNGVTFSLKAGSDAGLTIDPITGAVKLTGNPDYESKASYSFTVVATDAAGHASSQKVTLGINNLDEVAPTITSGTTAPAIDENSGAGQVIYTATATDTADISNGVTFSLKAGSDAGLTIDPITGAVTLTGNPDFESKASYSFTVVATDAAGHASSQKVTLGINNLDEVAPTITSGATATAIDENSGAGQVIYTATATDTADISNGVTFSLKAGSDAGLTIDPITGAVTLTGNPDFESKASYSFTVVATDAAGHASSQKVTLGINNLDEVAPTITSGATATAINENSGAGQVIYTATATDTADISGGVTFSLKAGSDAGLTIDPITGAVKLTGNPDFESKASYSFTVVATDAAGHASSKAVTLGINNLDEVAPTITSGTTAPAIDENSGAGQVIYTATATDTADISNGVTFSLKAGSDAGLTIDPITGAVKLTGNPDYESKASYSFTVVATDAAGNASSQKVTLDINNLDEVAPTITSGATATAIDENSGAGQVIYTASATDTADISGGVTFSLKAGSDAGLTIDPITGAVTLTGNPDYESKASYSFTVVATDAAGHASSQKVTLGINNLDEVAPTITSGTTAPAIDENSGAGQVIYTATATDTADISNGVTFSLKAGSDAGLTIDPITGAVTLTGNPDFESKASYSFTVVATDAAGHASSQKVTLGINNLDEVAPTIISGATATAIDENSGAGQVIYTATATDTADISNGVTFSLKAGSDAGLTIDPITGAVTLTGNPDYESKASYSFTVVATDAAGNASSQKVTLDINNLDEVAPTITSGATATAINENSGAGQVIYTATATDTADISGGVTFSLKAGSDAGLTIDPITGAVTLTGNPDYESKASYSFTVVATDAAGNASSQTVTLGINNLDEVAPTITSGATATAIDENSGAGQVIYTATATDTADISNGVTFSLKAGSDAGLTIDPLTGAVTLIANPDFESKASYSFTVVATDAAGHATSQTVTVNVTDVDEIAPTVTLDGSSSGPVMLSPATYSTYPNGFDTTALGDGSFLVTWAGNNNGSYGIYAQRLTAQGVALGEPVQLASGATNTIYNWSDSVVSVTAINDAGAYAVAWIGQDDGSNDTSIYTQLFNADGISLSAAVKLDGFASAQDIAPQIATLADGGYIVTWYISGGDGIYVQRFDNTGVAVSNTLPLAVPGSYSNASPQITVLDNGGYVVTWQAYTSGDYHIYVQQFDATGTGSSPVVLDGITGNSSSYETQPQITALTGGGYVVTWSGFDYNSSNYDSSTWVQQFDATGAKVGTAVELDGLSNGSNGGNYTYPYVAALADGGYAITWMEYDTTNGSWDYTVYVQQFTAGGSKVGAAVQLDAPHNNTSNNYDENPRITALGDGGYVVTWMGNNGSSPDIYVQKFNASGVAVGDIVRMEASGGAIDQFPQVTAVGVDGEYMVTWYAFNPASGMFDFRLYVQKFNADGSTYENLVVLNHDGHATVQSSESGTVYLVNDNVVVSQLSDITGAASDKWASTVVAANTPAAISAANLAEGTYHAWAVDAAGNMSVISGSSVMVDNTVPVFTSATTAADITDSTVAGDRVYTAAATDAHGVTYSLDDTAHFRINASTGVVTLISSPGQASGAQFIVTATDAAGNQTTQTVTYNVVDTTPPGVTLVSDADGVEHNGQTIIVQSSEAGTVYLVSDSVTVTDLNSLINAADNLANSVAVTANAGTVLALNGLDEGTYHAYAVDASGNVSAISGSSVIVDNTAPVILSGATGTTLTSGAAAGTPVYDANASDAHAITYSLDPDSLGLFNINATTGVVTLNSSAVAGSYNFIVTATDAAGNHSSQTVTVEVAVGNNLDGSAMVSGSTTDTATEMTVNVGLEKLSNGYTVVEYMRQTGGDNLTWDPTGALYDGVVRVLDASNNVVKTLDISVPAGYTMLDTQIKALANGGFVVAWSQVDTLNWNDYSVHYAIYDNSGNLQSSDTLASPGSGVTIAAQSSANGGDFAIAYQTMGPGTDQQEAISVFHYNGSGSSFTPGTQTLIGGNSASQNFGGVASPAVQLLKFQLTPGVLTALSDGSYVLASEVYDWIGTPGQAATSTPIGAFIFKLDATGTLANFDSGTTWARVNWNDEQGSPTNVIAFDGGFAVFSQEYRSATWEVTLYNNNGTLITTNIQSNTVYGMGSQSYHAVDVGAMDKTLHDELAWIGNGSVAASATAYDNGTDLVFVFPDGNGGLSQVTLSKTTGELTSAVTDSGITVPQGGQLYNPRIVSDGAGGYDITYSVLFDSDTSDGGKSGYAVGGIYQIGLTAPAAPTVTDAHIAITSMPGGADGNTYKVGDTVTAVWDNSASGDANTSTVTSVTMDFSQFGASTPTTAWDDGTHGDAIAGDGKYTAQYTLTAGAINNVDSRNVAVTVTTANHGMATTADSTGLTVDNTAPVLTGSTPQDNGFSVAAGDNLTLTFSENVLAGSGHITLVNESNSSLNKVIDITDSSQISISGNTVTVNPTTDLAAGANYHVQIDSTALHDTAGNNYAGISTSTGLNFTTASAGMGDPSIVVFDLTTGQSSDHNGRVFDANISYTLYIQIASNYGPLVGLDSNEMWSGAQNLGLDDKIVLVGTGSDVRGQYGDPVMDMNHGGNAVNWLAGFSISFSSYNVAGVDANGQFTRGGNNVDLWNGNWTVNPNGDNTFAQAYLPAMPAGILTSQGLAMP